MRGEKEREIDLTLHLQHDLPVRRSSLPRVVVDLFAATKPKGGEGKNLKEMKSDG